VITLDLHGARDFVPDGAALKVPVSTPEETVANLARAIDRYGALSASRKNEMSMRAWTFARTLSWPERAEIVERLYEQVLAKGLPAEGASATKMAAVGV
jgi:hypothetical protein